MRLEKESSKELTKELQYKKIRRKEAQYERRKDHWKRNTGRKLQE